jgi:uncharacterized protein YdbL (DUF1318 family)
MSPESRARVKAEVERLEKEMALNELREAREFTQQQVAEQLHVGQAEVSRLERRTDLYVSTLGRYIEAMGGRLEIRAVFPEGIVPIRSFRKV